MAILNMTGRRFGKLLVIGLADRRPSGKIYWNCLCDCGNVAVVESYKLRTGNTKSCKCAKSEFFRQSRTVHGHCLPQLDGRRQSPEYAAYCAAKRRCQNPKDAAFHFYGGRGIQFRFDSFGQFLDIIGHRPTPSHTLDRYPNCKGHYELGNVRWATRIEQANNTRSNHLITIGGRTKTLADWSKSTGIRSSTISYRVRLAGWCVECSLTQPVGRWAGRCSHKKEASVS